MNQRELNANLDRLLIWQEQINAIAAQMALHGQEVLMEHLISIHTDLEFQKIEMVQMHGPAVDLRRRACR